MQSFWEKMAEAVANNPISQEEIDMWDSASANVAEYDPESQRYYNADWTLSAIKKDIENYSYEFTEAEFKEIDNLYEILDIKVVAVNDIESEKKFNEELGALRNIVNDAINRIKREAISV